MLPSPTLLQIMSTFHPFRDFHSLRGFFYGANNTWGRTPCAREGSATSCLRAPSSMTIRVSETRPPLPVHCQEQFRGSSFFRASTIPRNLYALTCMYYIPYIDTWQVRDNSKTTVVYRNRAPTRLKVSHLQMKGKTHSKPANTSCTAVGPLKSRCRTHNRHPVAVPLLNDRSSPNLDSKIKVDGKCSQRPNQVQID